MGSFHCQITLYYKICSLKYIFDSWIFLFVNIASLFFFFSSQDKGRDVWGSCFCVCVFPLFSQGMERIGACKDGVWQMWFGWDLSGYVEGDIYYFSSFFLLYFTSFPWPHCFPFIYLHVNFTSKFVRWLDQLETSEYQPSCNVSDVSLDSSTCSDNY